MRSLVGGSRIIDGWKMCVSALCHWHNGDASKKCQDRMQILVTGCRSARIRKETTSEMKMVINSTTQGSLTIFHLC